MANYGKLRSIRIDINIVVFSCPRNGSLHFNSSLGMYFNGKLQPIRISVEVASILDARNNCMSGGILP